MPRRTLLRRALTALAAGIGGATVAAGVEAQAAEHPAPTARVSPLVRDAPISPATRILWRGDGTQRRAALTFDDGPDPRWTPLALELLSKHGARGTFFMLGEAVAERPGLAADVAAAGHEIGSHGWDHSHMTVRRADDLLASLLRTRRQIEDATGASPRLMRPPYGQFDAESAWAIARCDQTITLWSHRMTSDDPWARARENVATATPGMIVLSHDGRSTPSVAQMQAADWMVGQLSAQGWAFVPVSELLSSRPV